MATLMQRQRSRRKLAALTFLSNISLDGTHRDTKLSRYNLVVSFNKCVIDKEIFQETLSNNSIGPEHFNELTKDIEVSLEVPPQKFDNSADSEAVSRVPSHTSFREKSSVSELIIEKHVQRKRSCLHSVGSERGHNFSSNESLTTKVGSLGSNLISTGITGRIRKLSSTHSETSMVPSKEINFYRKATGVRIMEDRLVLLSNNKAPVHIFSCIPHKKVSEHIREGSKRRHTSGTRPLSTISDSTDPTHIIGMVCIEEALEVSYCDLLVPSKNFFVRPRKHPADVANEAAEMYDRLSQHPAVSRCLSHDPVPQHRASVHFNPALALVQGGRSRSLSISGANKVLFKAVDGGYQFYQKSCHHDFEDTSHLLATSSTQSYVPNVLDDPELRAGKHRKLLRFPSYMTSVIDYTKATELKKELNDKFREKFPNINLSLSKLRSLKREMAKIAKLVECEVGGLDVLLTVAHSYVYFEQLILKRIVSKTNRKLIAGACLILSAKMNDVKGEQLTDLIERTENVFRLNRRDLLLWEFAGLVALEFSLHIPSWMVSPHYQRLQSEM